MRLFYALEVPGELALQMADWRQHHLPLLGREIPPANFHITLAFLGKVDKHQLERLCRQTDDMLQAHSYPTGEIHLDQVGYWPRPGIYWLGPREWPDALNRLAGSLANCGNSIGAKHKRGNYRPHLTLFRGCEHAPPAPTAQPDFLLEYRRFALMETHQGRRGVNYAPLAEWDLGG